MAVDLWIGAADDAPGIQEQLNAVQSYVDEVGLCVTITDTWFKYTKGACKGFKIGLRNYPRFPEPVDDTSELLAHAEKIGKLMAEAGDQGSFMIEEHGGATYWLTRRLNDGASPQQMAECDCAQPDTCSRTGCEYG